jgi:hypothetical protein
VIYIKLGKLVIGKSKSIEKKNYKDINEFKYNKKTDLVPKKRNKLICVVFSEERGCHFLLRKLNEKTDWFRFKNGLYIIDNESIHITSNGSRVAFYLEGISTPIKMSNIERITETLDYKDLYGNKQKTTINKIKGLKFDAKILDTFANRRFAELFTKQPMDKMALFITCIFIFGIVTMIISVIGCIVTYVYR